MKNKTNKLRIRLGFGLAFAAFIGLGINAYFNKHLNLVETFRYLAIMALLIIVPVILIILIYLVVLVIYRKWKK
jgi:uncharacterized membrane protein YhdT